MKKKILSLALACMMLLLSGGIPAVLAAEEITVVRGLEFYGEDGLPVETVKQGLLTAKITLRAETAQAPAAKLVLVGYQETDGVKRLYSVHESEDTVLEQGVDTELSAAAQITQEEISGRVEYKAMVWKGGYVGEMTPVVDFKSLGASGERLTFTLSPEFARVSLKDEAGTQIYPNDGVYTLEDGKTYTYLVENIGYDSVSGEITGGQEQHLDIALEPAATEAGRLRITTPESTALNELEPVQLNALVEPLSAGNREITWSIKPGDEDKVELRVPDSQADGFKNEVHVKPGVTSGEAIFIATRVGTGETQELTLQIKEAVRTVSLTGLAAKGGSSLPGQGDDKPTGNLNVGTKYVTNWNVWTDYIYWSAVIPKDGIDYKVRMNYSALNPVDGAYVILKIKEILSTETGEDGGQQDDIIGDTIVEYHIPTPNTGSWGTYVKAYSTEVIGDAGKLEQNKRYRFELSRPQNSSAVNFDEIVLMPADYDPDAKPEGPEAVTGVRTDAGTVDTDGNASVNLYWNAYSGAQEYQIFIDNASEPAKIVDAQTRQVNIDGLTQHEVYKFTVKAKLADGTLSPEGMIQQNSQTPQDGVVFYSAQETQENRDWRMEWFRKAKYGMMVHWGPSSAFGGEYTGRQVGKTEEESIPHYSRANFPPELVESGAAPSNNTYTTQGYAEWIMNYAKIPREIYMTAAEEELDAGQYDFKEWVRLAKESGMRYLTVITKHHDGFAIMDTNGVGYNIIDHSAGGRDVFGELVRECRRQGMGIGAYYS